MREEYEEVVKREVQEAIASDRDSLERLCAKYLDNVRAYTTRETAADVAALRPALGIGEWNLLGISYGTRLALDVMPEQVTDKDCLTPPCD